MEEFGESDIPTGSARSNVGSRDQTVEVINVPDRLDVLLGRGKGNQQHAGNKRLQGKLYLRIEVLPYMKYALEFSPARSLCIEIVDLHKDCYFSATSRHGKVHIARIIANTVKEHGRFLKYNKGLRGWVQVSEVVARQKVCQSLQYHKRRSASQVESSRLGEIPLEVESDEAAGSNVASASVARLPSNDDDVLRPDMPASESDMAVAAALIAEPAAIPDMGNMAALPADETKQGEPAESDSDFMSIIRALSQGAHYHRQIERDEEGPSHM
jgi:hypothetical protein